MMTLTTSVPVREIMPLESRSEEAILSAVKAIISQPGVVRLEVDAGNDLVKYWRLISPEEAAAMSVSFEDALASVEMEEYSTEKEEASSFQQLFEMLEMIEDAGCVPCFILTGCPIRNLRDWIPFSRKAKYIYGVPLHFLESMERDVLILCGAPDVGATAADITYAVKVTLP